MKASTGLRVCLAIFWILGIASIIATLALESSLPQPLATWLKENEEKAISGSDLPLLALVLLAILSLINGTIGLLFLKRWGVWPYLVALVLIMILTPFWGPTVLHPLAAALADASAVTSGMVIVLAFIATRPRAGESPASIPADGPEPADSAGTNRLPS